MKSLVKCEECKCFIKNRCTLNPPIYIGSSFSYNPCDRYDNTVEYTWKQPEIDNETIGCFQGIKK